MNAVDSERWMRVLAEHPFGEAPRAIGGYVGCVIGSVMFPGWLVLFAVNGNQDPASWVSMVAAHLITGLVLFLLITLVRWRDECRRHLRAMRDAGQGE